MTGGTIAGNEASYAGGGVYTYGDFTMSGNAQICGNMSRYGGGVYLDGSDMIINNAAAVNHNTTTASGNGGGIYMMRNATLTMNNDSAICYNSVLNSLGNGGGVNIGGGSNSKITLNDNASISHNTAPAGGGVYMSYGTLYLKSGKISENQATGHNAGGFSYGGGAICVVMGRCYITGGEICNNKSGSIGGGIQGWGYAVEISGGTITGNSATDNGGGVYLENSLIIKGGYFGENSIYDSGNVEIIGGYFERESTAKPYITTEYALVDLSKDKNHYGDTEYLDAYPYAVYKNGDTSGYTVENVETTYGKSYTPSISGNDHDAEVTYSYVDNGKIVSGIPANVGKYEVTASFAAKLAVEADSTKTYYAPATKKFTVTIKKAEQTVPDSGEGFMIDYTKETITIESGYEIYTSKTNGTQISNGSITDYIGRTLYIHKAETSTHNASDWAEITVPSRRQAPDPPTSYGCTDNTITINTAEGLEYKIGTDGEWKTSSDTTLAFNNLKAETSYTIYARYPAVTTDNSPAFASNESFIHIRTKASAPAAPSVSGNYTVSKNDPTKFVYTITPIEGAEYSQDNITYQDSNVFDGIDPHRKVTFYARIKETDDVVAGLPGSIEVTFNLLRGTGSVSMADWTYGETASEPIARSDTNGTENMIIEYKVKNAEDSSYTAIKPTDADKYTVRVTFPETATYTQVIATADFSIKEAQIKGMLTISGNPVCGATLTENYTPADGEEVSFQWKRDGETIAGAVNREHILTVDDVGHQITVIAMGTDKNHTGSVTSDPTITVGPTYTVTIPEKVELGNTVTLGASGVNVESGKRLEVSLTGTSSDNNALTLENEEGTTISYTVTNGSNDIKVGNAVLTVNGGNPNQSGSTTLTFVKPNKADITYAGTYTGTCIFTVSVKENASQ
mgnify:CR=1 FL=1